MTAVVALVGASGCTKHVAYERVVEQVRTEGDIPQAGARIVILAIEEASEVKGYAFSAWVVWRHAYEYGDNKPRIFKVCGHVSGMSLERRNVTYIVGRGPGLNMSEINRE